MSYEERILNVITHWKKLIFKKYYLLNCDHMWIQNSGYSHDNKGFNKTTFSKLPFSRLKCHPQLSRSNLHQRCMHPYS